MKRIALFYAMTFLLLGVIPVIHGSMVGGPMDFDQVAARASAETGLTWTSNLLVVVRLCFAEPTLWLLVFGSAVPSLAALLGCLGGRSQMLALLGRFGLRVPWRRAVSEYAALSALMLLGLAAVYLLRSLIPGPEYSRPDGLIGPAILGGLLVAALLDQGAVLEELGWRGYALPELQAELLSPLGAAVVVGIGWGLWHLPRDITTGVIERLGILQYLVLYLPSFLAGTVTTSIIAAYFVNRCAGSILPAIMVHGLANDAIGLSGTAAMELALTPYHQASKALPFALIAVGIVVRTGRRLGLAREGGS